MVKEMRKSSFMRALVSNLSWAYLSQGISMLISMVFTLFIPKILGVEGYGYWQLIVFYSNYLGIFYLGINDGIYLQIGGKRFNEIDKSLLASEIRFFFVFHCACAIAIGLWSHLLVYDSSRQFVVFATSAFIPFFNLKGVLGQVLQAVNRTKDHSMALLIDKVFILLAVAVAFLLNSCDYRYYVVVYVLGGIFSALFLVMRAKEIVFAPQISYHNVKRDICNNFKVGLPLMLSSFASMLIIGSSRQVIDIRWGIHHFSTISLAISMMNLVLVFLNQSSMVLFPAIRRINPEHQRELYTALNSLLNRMLPLLLICYVPVGTVIMQWLPNYKESVLYLGILLPICLYDGKMNLLGNTYYKVLRMQKMLFAVNAITFLLNMTISLTGAYVFHNIRIIAVGLVFSIAMRSILSDIIISKKIEARIDRSILILIGFSALFLALHTFMEMWSAFYTYACFCLIYVFVFHNKLIKGMKRIENVVKNINNNTESM